MYTLKSIATRGTALGAAFALVASAAIPAASVFADALNPLTERSLMLSSSAPGYMDTDGSGNSQTLPNAIGENYAPAGSGPNGKKTGETFTFTISSDSPPATKGFSLQYCTTAAGYCRSPGDNTGDADPNNDGSTVDSTRQANEDSTPGAGDGGHSNGTSDLDFVSGGTEFSQGSGPGQFQVIVNGTPSAETWTFTKANLEDTEYAGEGGTLTGKNNYVTLTSVTGESLNGGDEVQIVFTPSEDTYITNPGSGSFFVKINTYSSDTTLVGNHNDATPADNTDTPGHTVIDGGVTVANVMTESIHITTKVLETMAFSVGTENRDTMDIGAGQTHGTCDPIQQTNNNRLNLGNPDAEYSLETGKAWDVHSYWRLSSNSSGGATVYYSGNTLANTVGDEIADMPAEVVSTPGTEQFGLGFVDAGLDTLDTGAADWAANYSNPNSAPFITLGGAQAQSGAEYPAGQTAQLDYDEAFGTIYDDSGATVQPGTAKFKFLKSSLTTPEPIAQQDTDVISCATAKMRYVGNIGADTPAGVYTTKINYLAAPQY
jgi:hypothetical protein